MVSQNRPTQAKARQSKLVWLWQKQHSALHFPFSLLQFWHFWCNSGRTLVPLWHHFKSGIQPEDYKYEQSKTRLGKLRCPALFGSIWVVFVLSALGCLSSLRDPLDPPTPLQTHSALLHIGQKKRTLSTANYKEYHSSRTLCMQVHVDLNFGRSCLRILSPT